MTFQKLPMRKAILVGSAVIATAGGQEHSDRNLTRRCSVS
jgi:hypothetical protein